VFEGGLEKDMGINY